jgi:hypothetical protein
MKQRINTVKEEWKKLLTFGALGWVKSSQIWGKMGSTSPITRHEREEELSWRAREEGLPNEMEGWGCSGQYIRGKLVPADGFSWH